MKILDTKIIGRKIIRLESVSSTNDIAFEASKNGEEEGAVFIAKEQTKGRGRFGRKWLSDKDKGIWLSILVYPTLPQDKFSIFVIASALSVTNAINEQTGLCAKIKWPNDVLINDLKTAGILVESRIYGDKSNKIPVVIGIGVNLSQSKEYFKDELSHATSIELEIGQKIDCELLTKNILRQFDHYYNEIINGQKDSLVEQWRKLSATIGSDVSLIYEKTKYHGKVLDITSDYDLVVRLDSGEKHIFKAEYTTLLYNTTT